LPSDFTATALSFLSKWLPRSLLRLMLYFL
jgi:hypothetical protein